jgi:hypothetical protein
MLITSNQMVTQWGHVFGDEMIAAAVLDRLLRHSHALIIQCDSPGDDSAKRRNAWIVIRIPGPFRLPMGSRNSGAEPSPIQVGCP